MSRMVEHGCYQIKTRGQIKKEEEIALQILETYKKEKQKKLLEIKNIKTEMINNYTKHDIDDRYFSFYMKQLKQYWKERENNELLDKHHKTFTNKMPQCRNVLTLQQRNKIQLGVIKHIDQMNKNTNLCYIRLKYNVQFPTTKEQKDTWFKINVHSIYVPKCSCCEWKDYFGTFTVFVRVPNNQSNHIKKCKK